MATAHEIRDASVYDRIATGEPTPPKFEHVMIDIETMSLHPHNALILSVGMIEFDPTFHAYPVDNPVAPVAPTLPGCQPDRHATFYVESGALTIGKRRLIVPSIEQQLVIGREVSPSTQKWWQMQSKEARAHWAEYVGERRSLAGLLADVGLFCDGRSRVWANGTQFDLSNLVGLNRQLGKSGQEELWHYQAPRDMRTFCRETPQMRIVPIGDALDIPGVPHEPVYDCISQAWRVWSHWQS